MGSLRGTALQQDLYLAVSAASSWLDAAENQLLSGPVLLSEDTETQLANIEVAHDCHAAITPAHKHRNMLALTSNSLPLFRFSINS